MKKVAVIIPIYNVEKYLNESVDSVINQTYKNLEIILVNDGSTDNSLHICREYLEKDERIHIINKENGGLSSARNAGLRYIFNENIEDLQIIENKKLDEIDYIQFFDSDDILNKYCIEISVRFIGDSDFTSFNFSYFINGTDQIKSRCMDYHIDNLEIVESREFLLNRVGWGLSWSWRGMIKKDILKGLRFKENIEYEDVLFGTNLFYYSNKVQLIPESLLLYRIRNDSIMDYGKGRKVPNFIAKLFKNSDNEYMKEYFKFHSYLALYEELYADINLRKLAPKLYDVKFIDKIDEDPLNLKIRFENIY